MRVRAQNVGKASPKAQYMNWETVMTVLSYNVIVPEIPKEFHLNGNTQ